MKLKSLIAAAVLAAGTVLVAPAAEAQIFKGETAGAGGPIAVTFIAFANQARKAGIEIQVNAGQTLTKSMLSAARGQIEFTSSVPSLYGLMSGGKAMYANVEDAPEAAKNLRSIFGFRGGVYHVVTKAGSGIEDWDDIAGRRVYVGPPAGAAAGAAEQLIQIVTGLVPGEDYEAIRLSWGEGTSALADGNVDLMVRPAEIGSALIQQFGLSGEFRLFSIPDEILEKEEMIALLSSPGRGSATFAGDVYDGQLTEGDITALGFFQFLGTHSGVDEEVVYQVTKSFWENLDDVHATASFLGSITQETAFVAVNAPLHKGAYRYYQEAGFDVPEALVPAD